MKIRLVSLLVSILVKPAVLVAAFAAVSRVAALSGFGSDVIEPVASSISEITPLSYNYAVVLVTAFIAYSLMRVLWAIVGTISPARR